MKKNIPVLMAALLAISTSQGLELSAKGHDGLNLKGDLRLRLQQEKKESTESRLRHRIRFRLGGHKNVTDKTTVKFGVATGGNDNRSTNQTLEKTFQTPDLRLDYAYVQHKVNDAFTVFGGKMKNPLYRSSDLLWDSDINPDGYAVRYKAEIDTIKVFINGGLFTFDELKSNTEDPSIIAIQPGVKWRVNENTKAKAALGVYLSQNFKGYAFSEGATTAGTNSLVNGAYDKEFASIALSSQVDFKNVMGLELVRPFGEVVINTNRDDANTGGIAGVAFGDKKVKGFGKWQSKISYRAIGADAWFDSFPDSDAYGGATGVKGFEFIFNYGLSKKTALGLDFYSMSNINGTEDAQSLVQVDLNVKF